ncbi:hypothetical protein [Xanthocytophaga flava]|nr:hypothetical protein [Xanthocytophaga flavus]
MGDYLSGYDGLNLAVVNHLAFVYFCGIESMFGKDSDSQAEDETQGA